MKRPLFFWATLFLGLLCLPEALFADRNAAAVMGAFEDFTVTKETGNDNCLYCHGVKGFSIPTNEDQGNHRLRLYVDMDVFSQTVHGKRLCVDCHTAITKVPHEEGARRKVDCVRCHTELSKKRSENPAKGMVVSERVVENIALYMDSIHAKPRNNDPSRPNAYCSDCHNGHAVYPRGSAGRKEFHLNTPFICGRCHEKQLKEYENSVHGSAVLRWGDEKWPVCPDCHTPHRIQLPKSTAGQLIITENCGNCHKQEYKSYISTYHGQVNKLGYVNTAKCFNCHESHNNKLVTDPASKVHPNNREKTCRACHKDVSPGFLSFQPHGNTHDFEKYPQMWLASKGMIGLLVSVFAVFWTHSFLWMLRERKEKKQGHPHKLPKDVEEALVPDTGSRVYVQRFPALWRLAHLSFALSIMVLGFTGLTLLYSGTFWARTVAYILGGPVSMAIIHRSAGVVFLSVFLIPLVAILHKLLIRNRKTFRWFGPHSLVPRWQDLWDLTAMLKWFFGKGPRPYFDHWTYWEKFDYWAPFWGVSIIGGSGLLLWFPVLAGEYLPGWIFNVATIFHGEEAVLAIVFIFSVHFFNCHLRPGKFPLDIMMFVGNMPLEEFKEERTVEFQRAVNEGQLEKMMVEPPSSKLEHYSRILGFTLIGTGLTLLFLALSGLFTEIIHFFS
ncbi:MAG: cytochrome c3 family protein [Alphaproteobacteria bacterium]|nr:cytochrome c3 family protein [Alphaproteobacteria bacterium]